MPASFENRPRATPRMASPHADTHGAAQDGLGVEGTLKNQGAKA